MKPKVQYNKKSKILSIRLSARKSVDSDVKGNIVVDYDKNEEIVNIDIMEIDLDEFMRSPKHSLFRERIKV